MLDAKIDALVSSIKVDVEFRIDAGSIGKRTKSARESATGHTTRVSQKTKAPEGRRTPKPGGMRRIILLPKRLGVGLPPGALVGAAVVTRTSDRTPPVPKMKTAGDCRTPKPGGSSTRHLPREASWSAPALWRFSVSALCVSRFVLDRKSV